ncbi:MAG: hypothetical protein KH374_01560, partial [Dialister sp.]|uniref:hypothetical protein n=1 Tax=Dialister sp. TaxID=1955814 RepID=UPI00257E4F25
RFSFVVVFFVQLHFTTRVRYGFLSVQLNYTIRHWNIPLKDTNKCIYWFYLKTSKPRFARELLYSPASPGPSPLEQG